MDYDKLTHLIGDLEEDRVLAVINKFVDGSPSEEEGKRVVEACQAGMAIVGDRYEDGEYFVGDLVFAGELLGQAIDILKPVISSEGAAKIGTVVLGTVAGDLHDIGKNIFRSLAEAAGFEVHDLGVDQSAEAFVDKVREVKPEVVGMSGILTLAVDSMKDVVAALNKAQLREQVKVIIGGNPVNQQTCDEVGADAYTTNAAEGVKICKKWRG